VRRTLLRWWPVFDLRASLLALALLLLVTLPVWAVSLVKRDVSIVDSLWGAMLALAAVSYAWPFEQIEPRGVVVLAVVALWAVRLSVYITWRNWGESEDHRYREIRRRNEPHFALKSLYLVFGLQAVLAWVVSAPLLAAQRSAAPLGALDWLGLGLAAFGLLFESIADWQLARFKASDRNRGRVLDRGLWRYSRHPNYFGECCVWWGVACFGLAAGGVWSLVSPLLMTFLLLRVSGVTLLEQSIGDRRPGYANYVRRTSAFLPLPRRKLAVNRAAADL
jgi:steroid 5-alpha reductase family enzyme